MAKYIKRGDPILIPFRDGLSIGDSQGKPRIYSTRKAFEKHFPAHYLGTNGVELVEFAEVVYCDDCVNHGNCIPEDTFRWVRIEKPFCCVGKKVTDDG